MNVEGQYNNVNQKKYVYNLTCTEIFIVKYAIQTITLLVHYTRIRIIP